MFWDVLDKPRQSLLKQFCIQPPLQGAYLAGGTALALMYGHRQSEDFDWFLPGTFDPGKLPSLLAPFGRVTVAETRAGTFHGWIDGIRVTWLHYPNPLLDPLEQPPELPGLSMSSPRDTGLMKWAALSDRGAKKDFLDLYELFLQGVSLEELFLLLPRKFPGTKLNLYHMVKSLSFFDDAEKDPWPVMLRETNWSALQRYFLISQAKLLRSLG
ncbi:nucleotidyl transferase AbiEii/AbiGii toxin family protein [Aminivibrio sp.]|jgi:hypothetical protein|uniref:nucleotidyl transferase AbiEii/AbiGii toxin family protein n=1 Tax=Aminivibrio sp. TaxID=1872489 RepID=UPI003D98B10E